MVEQPVRNIREARRLRFEQEAITKSQQTQQAPADSQVDERLKDLSNIKNESRVNRVMDRVKNYGVGSRITFLELERVKKEEQLEALRKLPTSEARKQEIRGVERKIESLSRSISNQIDRAERVPTQRAEQLAREQGFSSSEERKAIAKREKQINPTQIRYFIDEKTGLKRYQVGALPKSQQARITPITKEYFERRTPTTLVYDRQVLTQNQINVLKEIESEKRAKEIFKKQDELRTNTSIPSPLSQKLDKQGLPASEGFIKLFEERKPEIKRILEFEAVTQGSPLLEKKFAPYGKATLATEDIGKFGKSVTRPYGEESFAGLIPIEKKPRTLPQKLSTVGTPEAIKIVGQEFIKPENVARNVAVPLVASVAIASIPVTLPASVSASLLGIAVAAYTRSKELRILKLKEAGLLDKSNIVFEAGTAVLEVGTIYGVSKLGSNLARPFRAAYAEEVAKFRAKRFEAQNRKFLREQPQYTEQQVRELLSRGGIKTARGEIQTTFGKTAKVITADQAARLRASELSKSYLKGPEVKSRIAIIETGKGAIVTLETPTGYRTLELKSAAQDFRGIRSALSRVRFEASDRSVQQLLVPKTPGSRAFRQLPPPSTLPPRSSITPATYTGESAKTLDVGSISKIQLERAADIVYVTPDQTPGTIEPPRNIFSEIRSGSIVRGNIPSGIRGTVIYPSTGEIDKRRSGNIFSGKTRDISDLYPVNLPSSEIRTGANNRQILEPSPALKELTQTRSTPSSDVLTPIKTDIRSDIGRDQENRRIVTPIVEPIQTPIVGGGPGPRRIRLIEPEEPIEPDRTTPSFDLPKQQQGEDRKQFTGFDVFVKKEGFFKKVNIQPLTKKSALSLGAREVDLTTAARFRITETKSTRKPLDIGEDYFGKTKGKFRAFNVSFKGQRQGNLIEGEFIEKRKYRIDSPLEVSGLQTARRGKSWF